jgi:hypothetical protein
MAGSTAASLNRMRLRYDWLRRAIGARAVAVRHSESRSHAQPLLWSCLGDTVKISALDPIVWTANRFRSVEPSDGTGDAARSLELHIAEVAFTSRSGDANALRARPMSGYAHRSLRHRRSPNTLSSQRPFAISDASIRLDYCLGEVERLTGQSLSPKADHAYLIAIENGYRVDFTRGALGTLTTRCVMDEANEGNHSSVHRGPSVLSDYGSLQF